MAQKVYVGMLSERQSSLGISNEEVAVKLGISERTWRRWKDEGAVPHAYAAEVVLILRLRPEDVHAGFAHFEDTAALQRTIQEFQSYVALMEQRLRLLRSSDAC